MYSSDLCYTACKHTSVHSIWEGMPCYFFWNAHNAVLFSVEYLPEFCHFSFFSFTQIIPGWKHVNLGNTQHVFQSCASSLRGENVEWDIHTLKCKDTLPEKITAKQNLEASGLLSCCITLNISHNFELVFFPEIQKTNFIWFGFCEIHIWMLITWHPHTTNFTLAMYEQTVFWYCVAFVLCALSVNNCSYSTVFFHKTLSSITFKMFAFQYFV